MRLLALSVALFLVVAAPAAAQMTDLERERLVAHLEMTASWLDDEVSNLSQTQLAFRRAPGTWSILEVLEHLVVVGPIYWDDLQRGVQGPPSRDDLTSGDAAVLWYGINRTNREPALPSERRSAITLTSPSVSPTIIARPLPANRCLDTTTSSPASLADASVCPANATSGWQ